MLSGLPPARRRGEVGPVALSDLDPDTDLRDPARKQRYVTTLFDTIAPGYDRFTRLFSFGMDAGWKRRLVRWVAEIVRPGDLVLDLACGTGDMATAVERLGDWAGGDAGGPSGGDSGIRHGSRRRSMVLGLDPSAQMLRRAMVHTSAHPVLRFLRADMMSIPVANGRAAAVTVGYGFRNTPDATAALAEVARVLAPGGWLFDLDFFLPEHAGWRRLYLWYLRRAGRMVGRWWHDEPEAYGYIARSLEHWMTPGAFEGALETAGLRVERAERHLGGGICLHAARRIW